MAIDRDWVEKHFSDRINGKNLILERRPSPTGATVTVQADIDEFLMMFGNVDLGGESPSEVANGLRAINGAQNGVHRDSNGRPVPPDHPEATPDENNPNGLGWGRFIDAWQDEGRLVPDPDLRPTPPPTPGPPT